jgi:hypothetical protein
MMVARPGRARGEFELLRGGLSGDRAGSPKRVPVETKIASMGGEEGFAALLREVERRGPRRHLVIMGLAKSGTTLPLTLLDGHPDLLVVPEEIRFFHLGCDRPDGPRAAAALLDNANVRQLLLRDEVLTRYEDTGGTGVGRRDYSNVDFDRFAALLRRAFTTIREPRLRYLAVFAAFAAARGEAIGDRTLVSKAPHNELYLSLWRSMLAGDEARYVVLVRDPVELFLSLRNIDRMYGTAVTRDVGRFARHYRRRLDLVRRTAAGDVRVLRYEDLTDDAEGAIRALASDLGIPFAPTLLAPTKNGVPWGGNSSRRIQGVRVYRNPRVARAKLPTRPKERTWRSSIAIRASRARSCRRRSCGRSRAASATSWASWATPWRPRRTPSRAAGAAWTRRRDASASARSTCTAGAPSGAARSPAWSRRSSCPSCGGSASAGGISRRRRRCGSPPSGAAPPPAAPSGAGTRSGDDACPPPGRSRSR